MSYSAPGNCSQVPSRVSPTLRLAKATLTLIPVMGMQNLLFILIPSQARSKSCKFCSDTMNFQKFYTALVKRKPLNKIRKGRKNRQIKGPELGKIG